MSDQDGKRRKITIPPGMMRKEAWELVKMGGRDRLSLQMSEVEEDEAAFCARHNRRDCLHKP
jgi:hypothetical protein